MIVPKHWAEGRIQHREGDRQITIRRFGWSDESEEHAQALADQRAGEALQRVLAGEKLPKRDPKVSYNGAEGLPIREEIVSEHGETVVTRNLYGALCLNTPNILFADVHFGEKPAMGLKLSILGLVVAVAIVSGVIAGSRNVGLVVFFCATILGSFIASALEKGSKSRGPSPEQAGEERVKEYLARHPEWRVRLYRTPAGLRVLALHRTFDPHEAAVAEFFKAMKTDPIYARMCLNQNCFRARVSPKPWRIGIDSPLRPRPGVWPVKPEYLPARARWIAGYDEAAGAFASCRFMGEYGGGPVHPAALEVQQLHDRLCGARTDLPIA